MLSKHNAVAWQQQVVQPDLDDQIKSPQVAVGHQWKSAIQALRLIFNNVF